MTCVPKCGYVCVYIHPCVHTPWVRGTVAIALAVTSLCALLSELMFIQLEEVLSLQAPFRVLLTAAPNFTSSRESELHVWPGRH